MSGEKKSTLVVQGTSIPILSQDIGEFNSIEFEGIRDVSGWYDSSRERSRIDEVF
jgi:hypothetical protein